MPGTPDSTESTITPPVQSSDHIASTITAVNHHRTIMRSNFIGRNLKPFLFLSGGGGPVVIVIVGH